MHVKVLQRQLAEVGRLSFRSRWALRRRLGQYLKTAGDRARPQNLAEAWRHYLRSLRNWPFDHVVAARALVWPCRLLLGMS
jgi:hypothetical protein